MSVRSGQSITVLFTTRVFATGVATNADSTPAGTLYVNGTADAASVTVTNITTGVYKAAVTLPTLAVGDVVDLRIAATVSTIADNAVVWRDSKDVLLDSSGDVTFNNTSIATVTTVTTVTNQLTAAAIATGVWQDATGADFTAASSIGKSLYTSGVVPGGTNGLFIAGTNAATTITTSLTTHLIGTVDTVTTVTNQLTAAAIATGIWQDATGTDFTTASSIGKSLYTSGVVPGAASGLLIAGSNAATTFATLTSTGAFTVSGVSTVSQTGDAFARIGVAGLGLSSIPDLAGVTTLLARLTSGRASNLDFLDVSVASRLPTVSYTAPPSAASIVTAVFTDLLAGSDFSTAASFGKLVKDNLDATVSSRSTYAGGAVASVTAGVTVTTNNDKTGYGLASTGLDLVVIETGLNARQALSIATSAAAGVLAGAATTTITIAAAGAAGTPRISATVDGSGNRSAVTLSPPA